MKKSKNKPALIEQTIILNKYINNNMSNWNSKNYSDTKISIDINPTSLL